MILFFTAPPRVFRTADKYFTSRCTNIFASESCSAIASMILQDYSKRTRGKPNGKVYFFLDSTKIQ